IRLRERPVLFRDALAADVVLDLVPKLPPAVDRSLTLVLFDAPHGPVERDPGHRLRVNEVTTRAAHLPDPLVGLPPSVLEPLEELLVERPCVGRCADPRLPCVVEGVRDLPVDVELELAGGGVADPHGPRAFVAVEPLELELRQPPLSGDPVHDLDLTRSPRDRSQQPVAPRA